MIEQPISIVALLWTGVAAGGVVLSGALLLDGIHDIRALGALANGRRMIARAHIRREAIRVVTHLAYFGVGVGILEREIQISPIVLILITGNVGMIVNSALDVRLRYLLYRSREDPKGKPPGVESPE